MTTVKTISESFNKEQLICEDGILTPTQMREIHASSKVANMIQDASKTKSFNSKKGYMHAYEITSEEVLNSLRELYKATSNKFVKSVVATVGKSKRFSDKQMNVICDEIVKFENIQLNF